MTPKLPNPIPAYLLQAAQLEMPQIARNFARLFLGRARQPANLVSARMLLRDLASLEKIKGITYLGSPREGGGAQIMAALYAQSFARATGIPYLHTPFTTVAHAECAMEQWADAWENVLNLGEGAQLARDVSGPVLDFGKMIYYDKQGLKFLELLGEGLEIARSQLRDSYWSRHPDMPSGPLRVVAHFRNGDVAADRNVHMWTPPEIVARTIRNVCNALTNSGLDHRVLIASQGNAAASLNLNDETTTYQLDGSAITSLHELAQADILIMAKSSFSHVAAMLSRGIVLYQPHFYAPMRGWLKCSETGDFDYAIFAEQTANLRWPTQGPTQEKLVK